MDGIIQLFIKELLKGREDSKQSIMLSEAIRESIIRELRFNAEIFKEISNNSDRRAVLVKALKNSAFKKIEDSMLPLNRIINERKINTQKLLSDEDNGNHIRWFSNTKTNIELLEKVYSRIEILQALENAGIEKNNSAIEYSKFLIMTLQKLLKNINNEN